MKNDLLESANKDIPTDNLVVISTGDLINNCKNKKKLEDSINKEFDKFLGFIESIVGERIPIIFFTTMAIGTNPDTLETELYFAPQGFISSLVYNLNLDDACRNECGVRYIDSYSNIIERLKERVDLLKKTHKEIKLKGQFPMIYETYEKYANLAEQLIEIERKIIRTKNLREAVYLQGKYDAALNRINSNELLLEIIGDYKEFSVEKFCKKLGLQMEKIVDNAEEISKKLFETPIELSIDNDIDRDMINLYIAHQYLSVAEVNEYDEKQDLLYYVSNYLMENKDKLDSNIEIECGGFESKYKYIKGVKKYKVTPRNIYERFQKLLKDNPDLLAINLDRSTFDGMTLDEVQSFMENYKKDLTANWEFLSSDSLDEEVSKAIRRSTKELSDEEREKKQERLMEIYAEKRMFFDSSIPLYRIMGKNTFDGYIGYIYSTGKVALDKFYENKKTGRIADNNAIYGMKIEDFYRLSGLSKSELIHNPLCKRFIHKGNWQDKVNKFINEDNSSSKTVEEIKKLIKSGKIN